jgi:hypothetical protein
MKANGERQKKKQPGGVEPRPYERNGNDKQRHGQGRTLSLRKKQANGNNG